MSFGKKDKSTSTTTPSDPRITAGYDSLLTQAQGVANQPLQLYQGNLVAGLQPEQQSAIDNINRAQGLAQPYYDQAAELARQGTTPITQEAYSREALQKYYSPYQQDVIDATRGLINQQNSEQQRGLAGNITSAGAWGGDRSAVLQAELARQQDLAGNATLANLENTGFQTALGQFNTSNQQSLATQQANNQNSLAGASALAGLGSASQNSALAGANAQMGAGTLQQQIEQQKLNVPYEQYLQTQAYPYQNIDFLSSILGQAASGTGSTTTQEKPGSLFASGGHVRLADGGMAPDGSFYPSPDVRVSMAHIPDMSHGYVPNATGALPHLNQAQWAPDDGGGKQNQGQLENTALKYALSDSPAGAGAPAAGAGAPAAAGLSGAAPAATGSAMGAGALEGAGALGGGAAAAGGLGAAGTAAGTAAATGLGAAGTAAAGAGAAGLAGGIGAGAAGATSAALAGGGAEGIAAVIPYLIALLKDGGRVRHLADGGLPYSQNWAPSTSVPDFSQGYVPQSSTGGAKPNLYSPQTKQKGNGFGLSSIVDHLGKSVESGLAAGVFGAILKDGGRARLADGGISLENILGLVSQFDGDDSDTAAAVPAPTRGTVPLSRADMPAAWQNQATHTAETLVPGRGLASADPGMGSGLASAAPAGPDAGAHAWDDGTPIAKPSPHVVDTGYEPSPWMAIAKGALTAIASRSLSRGALAGLDEWEKDSHPTIDNSGDEQTIVYGDGTRIGLGIPTAEASASKEMSDYRRASLSSLDADRRDRGEDRRTNMDMNRQIHEDAIAQRAEAARQASADRAASLQVARINAATNANGGYQWAPGSQIDPKTGQPVSGMWRLPTRGDGAPVFMPGDAITSRTAPGGGSQGATIALIDQLKKDNPKLTTEQALGIIKDPSGQNGAALNASMDRLAQSAAKGDPEYMNDPVATLDKYRKYYGVGQVSAPRAAPAAAAPAGPVVPPGVPQGSLYSPSRKMWKDPAGKLYNAAGQPLP